MLDTDQLDVVENPEAPPAASIISLPLDQLMLSGLNVRKTERDADIAALAEDIAARGLKQNLVVVAAHFSTGDAADENNVDWAYQYEVVAGGRRFQALRSLAEAGRIPADHPVPCLLEMRSQARETSLSENLHKVSMNPADEFAAYATIVDQAKDQADPIAYCAQRFGTTVKHVNGRLRLATLAPEILQALRENAINLDSAKAYAGVTDHKLQLKVFKDQGKSSWKTHDPKAVREQLRGKSCAVSDYRVLYIGLEAYVAAGGRVEVEMFMGADGVERIADMTLLDKLAKAKAADALTPIAKAEGWKEVQYAGRTSYDIAWPGAPKGFVKAWEYNKTLADITKAERKKSIGVYAIAKDGSELVYVGRFKPDAAEAKAPYVAPTPEELAETERQDEIDAIATRLAVGPFAGTPFEGRAFWPNQRRWIDAFDAINDDEVLVAVLVKVTGDEIQAQREEAAKRYDAKLAEQAAAEAEVVEDDETDETAE